MDDLIIIGGLILVAIPISLIYLFASHSRLKQSVLHMRQELRAMQLREVERDAVERTTQTPAAEKTAERPPATDVSAPPAQATMTQPEAASIADIASTDPQTPPKAYVFGAENMARFTAWMKENWFYAVAALSLTMAGIFLVQYGIEHGILSPRNRVLCALVFGAALIAAGEWIRRKSGDGSEDLAAFLPSTFAGAGIVTLYSGQLAARQLYGLIGAEMAFAGLVGIAALAIFLGWVYGPFLTAIGIIGAVAVPFAVSSGENENIVWLFYYFALICAVGLGVDAMKRSAWISTIAIAVPCVGAVLIWLGSSEGSHFLAFAGLVAVTASCLPMLSTRPAFNGAMSFHKVHFLGAAGWPEFPTRLAAGGLLALAAVAVVVSGSDEVSFWLALGGLATALAALAFWFDRSAVLDDLAVPIAVTMLAIIGLQGLLNLPAAETFRSAIVDVDHPQPMAMMWLTGFGLLVSAMLGWKSLRDTRFPLWWAVGAAVFAPAVVILLGLFWKPLTHLSDTVWAMHVLAVAALMTLLAERAMRVDGAGRLRVAVFALAALNMIALSMSIVLTETALTLGFAGLVVSGAWLDRKFDIKPVTWFVQLGVLACGFRLIMDPGLRWALEASLGELCIGFGGVISLLAVAWWLLQTRERTNAIIVTESAVFSLLGIFISVLIYRALQDDNPGRQHWSLSLFAMVWLISAAAQLYRAQIGGMMRLVRLGLGAAFGALGLGLLLLSFTYANPLVTGVVKGPLIIDSLMVAYLLPALICGAVAWRFAHLDKTVRIGLGVVAAISVSLWIGLEIRRLWRGTDLTVPGVLDGELYTYTIVMLLLGSATLLLAYLRRSPLLRKLAIGIIALTIAKVFLIDMSGLEGLIRVLSFLALGLVLAGLALLNRWMTRALEAEA